MIASRKIALLGKIGHGKTHLLNKLCGTSFSSNVGSKSCTRSIQSGYSINNGILVIDTPGFYSSEDIASHVAAQKYALEGTELSGIYIVVKFGRVDEIVDSAGKIMDFIGDDDIRIIVTYGDIASTQEGYSEGETIQGIADLLDIPNRNIFISGTEHSQLSLESFIVDTLHEPRKYEVSKEQEIYVSSVSVAKKKFKKTIKDALSKIEAASKTCLEITSTEKSYKKDIAISITQTACRNIVDDVKYTIFHNSEDLDSVQREILIGKVQLEVLLKLKEFLKISSSCFSWDTTDNTDDRNLHRQCPNCHTVYHKSTTENCDENESEMCTGESAFSCSPAPQAIFEENVDGWRIQFFCGTRQVFIDDPSFTWSRDILRSKKRQRTNSSLRCEKHISWSTMLPVDPELLRVMHSKDNEVNIERETSLLLCFDYRKTCLSIFVVVFSVVALGVLPQSLQLAS